MALHALNVLDQANWVEIKDSDGNQTGMQYNAPKAEEAHMEPIRKRAAPRLEENTLRMAILDELFTKAESTPSFLEEALLRAKKHQHVFDHRPEFDSDGRLSII